VTRVRIGLAVAACAVVVHLGALWNGFAFDDVSIVAFNPVVHSLSGVWRVFAEPYWPGNLSGAMYRPLPVATFALDWAVGPPAWFHAVNLVWHAAVSVLVAVLTGRWVGRGGGLAAGLVFAVHPVHVEAVANIVGRSELMAALFAVLAVYAALERRSIVWSTVALALAVLSKEIGAVVPALIVWGWLTSVAARPSRRRVVAFAATWLVGALLYGLIRWWVLHGYAGIAAPAPVFAGQPHVSRLLTAVAAVGEDFRLLVFPLHLSADYSPNHRTAVTTALDWRFLAGLGCVTLWALLVTLARRRGCRVEAFGLGWIGIALLPVSNLLFPIGVLIAERTLYLPSVGLAVVVGAWASGLAPPRPAVALVAVVLLGGIRSALRVPVWKNNQTVTLSLFNDAPQSYRTWHHAGWQLLLAGRADRALDAFLRAGAIYPKDHRVALAAAHAALELHQYFLADSLFRHADANCQGTRCVIAYRNQADAARVRGASEVADTMLARARRLAGP